MNRFRIKPREIITCKCGHRAESHGDNPDSVAGRRNRLRYPEDFKGCRACVCKSTHADVLISGIKSIRTQHPNKRVKGRFSVNQVPTKQRSRRSMETVPLADLKRL